MYIFCRTLYFHSFLLYEATNTNQAVQNDLEVLIANVLDIWSEIDPKRIFVKPKLHLLVHLLFDIRDHGPAGLYATEIFECFNAIFRMCSVLSNHQAPSRDIALACADMDRFKHQVSGGWWRNESGFVRAGEAVRRYFNNPDLQRRLGYAPHSARIPGQYHCLFRIIRNATTFSCVQGRYTRRRLTLKDAPGERSLRTLARSGFQTKAHPSGTNAQPLLRRARMYVVLGHGYST